RNLSSNSVKLSHRDAFLPRFHDAIGVDTMPENRMNAFCHMRPELCEGARGFLLPFRLECGSISGQAKKGRSFGRRALVLLRGSFAGFGVDKPRSPANVTFFR
ncbi:MAG: hypothetical protein IOC42_09530, partial [Methylobacterium sp.]|nr:hypothetical protein [Methylobacterium sp.]